jgi:hypothetical protein
MVETLGDPVRIVLDGTDELVYPKSSLEPAWNSSTLDPTVFHTIEIVKVNFKATSEDEEYMSFYSLLVTHPDLSTITTTSAPSSTETENPTKPPETQPELTATANVQPEAQTELAATTKMAIAGAVVGIVCLGLLGVLGTYFWRRRNKHDSTLNPFRKLEGGTSLFQSTDALFGEFCIRIFISKLRPDIFSSNGWRFSVRG